MCLKISLKVRIILKACMKQTYTSHIQYIIYIIYTSYIHHIYITYTSYVHHIYIIYTSYIHHIPPKKEVEYDPTMIQTTVEILDWPQSSSWKYFYRGRSTRTTERTQRFHVQIESWQKEWVISWTHWDILRYIEIYWDILRYIEIYWDILRYRDILRYIEIYWDYEIENQYVIETKMKLIDTDWQIRHCCLIENDSNIFQHYNTASSATVLLLSCCSAARCHASGLAASSPPTSTSSKRACAEQSAPQPLEASASTPSLFSPTPWPQEISKF